MPPDAVRRHEFQISNCPEVVIQSVRKSPLTPACRQAGLFAKEWKINSTLEKGV
jgi:hypothetical protein